MPFGEAPLELLQDIDVMVLPSAPCPSVPRPSFPHEQAQEIHLPDLPPIVRPLFLFPLHPPWQLVPRPVPARAIRPPADALRIVRSVRGGGRGEEGGAEGLRAEEEDEEGERVEADRDGVEG